MGVDTEVAMEVAMEVRLLRSIKLFFQLCQLWQLCHLPTSQTFQLKIISLPITIISMMKGGLVGGQSNGGYGGKVKG